MPPNAALPSEALAAVRRWLRTWHTPDLAARTTIEFSPRLTRSLGRCYPDRRLIRLASLRGPSGASAGQVRPHGPE